MLNDKWNPTQMSLWINSYYDIPSHLQLPAYKAHPHASFEYTHIKRRKKYVYYKIQLLYVSGRTAFKFLLKFCVYKLLF